MPLLLTFLLSFPVISNAKLKVFILAGQSNMAGRGVVYIDEEKGQTKATLENYYQENPEVYGHLKENGEWVVRDDVWIWCNRTNKNLDDGIASPVAGPLTVGQGYKDHFIGPEFGFGLQVGDLYEDQVLLMKHAWGGTSVGVNWLTPTSENYPEPNNINDKGFYYKLFLEELRGVLDNIGAHFPEYDESEGYEIVGMGWHQGWNDTYDGLAVSYEDNLADLIKDVRKELDVPDMPFVIGASEHEERMGQIKQAQVNLGDPSKHPEFEGTVKTSTGDFARTRDESCCGGVSHYYLNAETFYLIGDAMGKAMVDLLPEPDNPIVTQNPATQISDVNVIRTENMLTVTLMGGAMATENSARIEMFSLTGERVFSQTLKPKSRIHVYRVPLGGLKPGVYIARVSEGKGVVHRRILLGV